jgi:HTH-type transcriptional regulator/antitoxin HigA
MTMLRERIPAEVFPPCEYLVEELEARGWTKLDFVRHSGLDLPTVEGLCDGTIKVTVSLAAHIGAAFGTSSAVWANLQRTYSKYGPKP